MVTCTNTLGESGQAALPRQSMRATKSGEALTARAKVPASRYRALAYLFLCLPIFGATAVETAPPSVADNDSITEIEGTLLWLQSDQAYEKAVLTVSGPEGFVLMKSFKDGEPITADLLFDSSPKQTATDLTAAEFNIPPTEAWTQLPDGQFRYEVVLHGKDGSEHLAGGQFAVSDGSAFKPALSDKQASDAKKQSFWEGVSAKATAADDSVSINDTAADNSTFLAARSTDNADWFFNNQAAKLLLSNGSGPVFFPLALQTDGRVGFGTTNPQRRLHALGPDEFFGPGLRMSDIAGAEFFEMIMNTTGDGFLNWHTNDGTNKLVLTNAGRFGVGGTPGSQRFMVSATNSFNVLDSGDVGSGTSSPASSLHVLRSNGSAQVFVEDTGSTSPLPMFVLKNDGSIRFTMANTTGHNWAFSTGSAGFSISRAGTGPEMLVRNNGNVEISGSLSEGSSRSIKDAVVPVDHDTVLAKLDTLEIAEWSYDGNLQQRHMGPMAEDFHATFGLGPDDKHIAPKDLAGVALAAAKALKAETSRLEAENAELKEDAASKEARIAELESRLARIESLIRN